MSSEHKEQVAFTRRQLLSNSSRLAAGNVALSMLLADSLARGSESADSASKKLTNTSPPRVHPALPGLPHFQPKAKALIYLHMNGAPSQLDLWDYKPGLAKFAGQDLPDSVRKGQRLTTMTSGQAKFPVAPSIFKFTQEGSCGRWINSQYLPHTAKIVDEIALVKTVHTNAINHDPACTFVMTGSEVPGKASIGSWLAYGLGSENNNLPAFVVLTPRYPEGSNGQALFSRMWGSGFLPTRFTGTALRGVGDPVLYLRDPDGLTRTDREQTIEAINRLNRKRLAMIGDPEIQTRISQYEMAFRMQTSVPELINVENEPKHVLDMYGPNVKSSGSFANSALLARRLIERGVRVVQILHRGWDQHGDLPNQLKNQTGDTDQATAALVLDLKQRGLLDSTLVVWGGEFGRTVYSQGTLTKDNYGRDHHPKNFCMWLAGGGIKPGISLGETDDFSYNVVDKPIHINDLNATILHCLGIDHERLSYKFQGLDQRLTGVEPQHVIKELLT